MRRVLYICLSLLLLGGCLSDSTFDPYDAAKLSNLNIEVVYPDEYADLDREGGSVSVKDIDRGNSYSVALDKMSSATIELTNGRYIVQYSASHNGSDIFNATADQVLVAGSDRDLVLDANHSTSGGLVIKEIYNGGCSKWPQEGTYQYDKYVIIHNNTSQTQYLDGLCYGVLDPYNSTGNNVWVQDGVYADELYLVQAVCKIGGSGTDFPLEAGEDAVIVNSGAIDHTLQYPLSVNLNRSDYFVIYNSVYFTNTYYHPAPGDQIQSARYLDVVVKLGVANAWVLSVTSPAPVIFRPIGTTIEEYILQAGSIIQKTGSTVDKVMRVPLDWVLDGVEVFDGGSSSNTKRFNPKVDAGYVYLSESFEGKSLHRHVDEEASAAAGYEILVDTNNSSNDLYERGEASLRDE